MIDLALPILIATPLAAWATWRRWPYEATLVAAFGISCIVRCALELAR